MPRLDGDVFLFGTAMVVLLYAICYAICRSDGGL
jgi:hypothetical protein